MRDTIAWVLGVAAIAAALRGAWLHHMDNQLVIRTDWQRDGFIAGQAAERARAKAEADAERQAAYFADVGWPRVDPEIPGWIERGGPGQGSSG